MKRTVVISQSMYFPWIGLFEQIQLSNVFIHYDDVQYTRGFYNRVQIKTANGSKWLTVPLRDQHQGQLIDQVLIDNRIDWQTQHRDIIKQAYLKAPFRDEALKLMDRVFEKNHTTLSDLSRDSVLSIAKYFSLTDNKEFLNSVELGISGSSSQRLHDICVKTGAHVYLTGHGARNYLDHELFQKSNIMVEYMKYRMIPYPQLHGEFTPHVTTLDLIANCGTNRADVICSETIKWQDFLKEGSLKSEIKNLGSRSRCEDEERISTDAS
jgi:hypothetical protein